MSFWGIMFLGLLLITILIWLCPDGYKRYILKIEYFIIWFVASFRYQIGSDYDSYLNLFYTLDRNEIFKETVELSFVWLVDILHSLGLSYQMLFISYETVIIFFLYLGTRKYIDSPRYESVFVLIYFLFVDGFWYSMNNIRAAAALTLSYWNVSFLLNDKKYAYYTGVILASFIHNSAIAFVFLPLLINLNLNRLKAIVGIGFSFALAQFNFIPNCLTYLILLDEKREFALQALSYSIGSWSIDGNVLLIIGIYFISLVVCKRDIDFNDILTRKIFVLATFWVWMLILTSYLFYNDNIGDMITRLKMYFTLFYVLYITIIIRIMLKRNKLVILMILIILTFVFFRNLLIIDNNNTLKSMSSLSQGNIYYRCNLSIFEE